MIKWLIALGLSAWLWAVDDWFLLVEGRAKALEYQPEVRPQGYWAWHSYRLTLAMEHWQPFDSLPLPGLDSGVPVVDWLAWSWLAYQDAHPQASWSGFMAWMQQHSGTQESWLGAGLTWDQEFRWLPEFGLLASRHQNQLSLQSFLPPNAEHSGQIHKLMREPEVLHFALVRSSLLPDLGVWMVKESSSCQQGRVLSFRLLSSPAQTLDCGDWQGLWSKDDKLWALDGQMLVNLYGLESLDLSPMPVGRLRDLYWQAGNLYLLIEDQQQVSLYRWQDQQAWQRQATFGQVWGFVHTEQGLLMLQDDAYPVLRWHQQRLWRLAQPLPFALAVRPVDPVHGQSLSLTLLSGQERLLSELQWQPLAADKDTKVQQDWLRVQPRSQARYQLQWRQQNSINQLSWQTPDWQLHLGAGWGLGARVGKDQLLMAIEQDLQLAWQHSLPDTAWQVEPWLWLGDEASVAIMLRRDQRQRQGDGGLLAIPIEQGWHTYGHWQPGGLRVGLEHVQQWQLNSQSISLALGLHLGEQNNARQPYAPLLDYSDLLLGSWQAMDQPWVISYALQLNSASSALPRLQPMVANINWVPWQVHWRIGLKGYVASEQANYWLEQEASLDTGSVFASNSRLSLGWQLQPEKSSWFLRWQGFY